MAFVPASVDTRARLDVVLQTVRNANTKWLGFRYVLISGFSLNSPHEYLTLPAAGVSEIIFPSVTSDLFKIPTLSTEERYIPYKRVSGNLILRAPVTRDTSLWDRMKNQLNSLTDFELYPSVPETLIIGEFETKSILDLIPIAIWTIRGAQPRSFTPASANAQGTGSMPLEELILQVDSCEKLSSF